MIFCHYCTYAGVFFLLLGEEYRHFEVMSIKTFLRDEVIQNEWGESVKCHLLNA